MNNISMFLIFVTHFCISNLLLGQINDLEVYFSAHQKLGQFNGNVLFSNQNKIVFQKSYNIDSLGDSLKVNLNSKFIIASLSKVFIKVAIFKLQEQGKLSIYDTISKYISKFPHGDKITIEQLLKHKSGLPREITNYKVYDRLDLNEIIELARKEKILYEPNTRVSYSNLGYFLLHKIIEIASNKGYFQYMHTELFEKLNLTNTFEYNYSTQQCDIIMGFTNESDLLELIEPKSMQQFETGNIATSIHDLYEFSRVISSTNFLSKSSKEFLFESDSLLIQAGGRKGYRAYFQVDIKNNCTFIMLSNQSNIPFEEIIAETKNILNYKPYTLPKNTNRVVIEVSDEILKQYEGLYSSAEHNMHFVIKLMDKSLVIVEDNSIETKLYPESENSFFDHPKSKDSYSFINNEEGEVVLLQVLTNGMKIILQKFLQ